MEKSSSKTNFSFFISIFTIIVISIYPILAPYKLVSSVSIGLTLIVFTAFLCIIFSRKIIINVPFLILLGVHSLLSIIAYFSLYNKTGTESIIWSIIMAVITSFAIMQFIPFYDRKLLLKTLILISIIASILLIYQLFMIVRGIIPYNGQLFNELVSGYAWSDSVTYMRPNSFFSEPSYFAIYLLPTLVLLLNNKSYLLSLFVFTSLVLSTSSLGIIGGLLILVVYSIVNKSIRRLLLYIVGLGALIMLVVFFLNLEWLIQFNLSKITNLQNESSIRLIGYLEYFQLMPEINQLIGVGFFQLSNYFSNYNLSNYSNAFVLNLINFGIVGLAAYIFYIIYSLYNEKKEGFLFIAILVIVSSVDAFIYTPNFYYILYFVFVFAKKGTKIISI